ncbi:MAG: alpha-L-fucosidase, partial [Bacteroidales bacterium]|nr:alpha-L-fucosidase [Bacteroidales bacterium]
MKLRNLFYCIILAALTVSAFSQETEAEKDRRMQWFGDAKLGIFIHWGIYAVNGIDESWS